MKCILIMNRKARNWSAFAKRKSKASASALSKEGAYNRKASPITSYQQRGGEKQRIETGKKT